MNPRSPDEAQLAERNPGSAAESRIPAFGRHPGYACYQNIFKMRTAHH